jgi:nitroimidazol reductase NimA-like FMN-containing flavoprotein (pyridoxamine 5'-phosphate oxidase superfamily)
MTATEALTPTDRTTLRRLPARGSYERAVIDEVLDEALICHLAFVADGAPMVIPTIHARVDDVVYLHGSVANRALRAAGKGAQVCLSVTLLDGLVLARSAFHHSMNYRSVVLLGEATVVADEAEKLMALDAIVDHVVTGRSAQLRPHTPTEVRTTTVLALPIVEGSAKVRTGGPVDDEEDLALDVWAGVLPLHTVAGRPIDDEQLRPGIAVPANIAGWRRP